MLLEKGIHMVNRKFKLSVLIFIVIITFLFGGIIYYPTVTHAVDTVPTKTALVPVKMYNPTDNTGYQYTETEAISQTVYGANRYTSLSINVDDGNIRTTTYNGVDAYGITGASSLSLKFKINYASGKDQLLNNSNQWMLAADTWGSKESQLVNGIRTGNVLTGAVIVQKSYDGITWSNDNLAKTNQGLFTTDFYTIYETNEKIVYTPSGEDINIGIYVRLMYAYEVYDYIKCTHENTFIDKLLGKGDYKHANDNDYENYIEVYTVFISNDSAESVTFHNLSLNSEIETDLNEVDASMIEVMKKAETLNNESVTTTGFSIDKSLNVSASVTVQRNHQNYQIPFNYEIREEGRYDITVRTRLGSELKTTIYVVLRDKEELYSMYFGGGFLSGKRIYSKDTMPVFEGGLTLYNILQVSDNYPFIFGSITNQTTGTSITIDRMNTNRNEMITEAGLYEAKFNTNFTYSTDEPSGDNHVLTFRFRIIERGTAPGPQLNKESLTNYSNLVLPSNLSPTFYGVTFQSAHKGNITLAFSNHKDALDFAYNYEKGMVEIQPDGSYRYTGSFVVSQKIKYDSAWDLTDAVYFFAEQAVQKLRFDLRDEFTYLTLSKEVLSTVDNLRKLELNRSVVIIANDNQTEQMLKVSDLPIINARKYAYLTPGLDGEVTSGYQDFLFIKDINGYDTNVVTIIDALGNRYGIEFNIGVSEQLINYGLDTGIITIEEKNIYGDTTTYQAVFIKEDDNTSIVDIQFYLDDEVRLSSVGMNEKDTNYKVDAFSISSVIDLFDKDGTISMTKDDITEFYSFNEVTNKNHTEAGIYIVELVNRFGFAYSFTIEIEEQVYFSTQLIGEGVQGELTLVYYQNDTLKLPILSRYGYHFLGFKNVDGTIYSDEVLAMLIKGSTVLEAVWEAKQFRLTLNNGEDIYKEELIEFGQTYDLVGMESTETEQFIGWYTLSGDLVTNITLDKEEDIKLYAQFKKIIQPTTDNKDVNTPFAEEKFYALVISTLSLGTVVAIIGVVIFIRKKRVNFKL